MPDREMMALAGGVLSREEILDRIRTGQPPLLREMPDADAQVQPNGVDLTLGAVQRHLGAGRIAVDNSGRLLPELEEVLPDDEGWFRLSPGAWHITYNEIVALPDDLMALGRPRSSLARCGVAIHTAVWAAGYEGRSTSLLQVVNLEGFWVQRDARVMQLVFLTLSSRTA